MRLADVYSVADSACYLYALMLEREPHQNISHKSVPTVAQHLGFVRSLPYREWHLVIEESVGVVGATYISKQNEIGIFIFKAHRGHGYGRRAVEMLLERHRGQRLVANINPMNTDSQMFFTNLGAKLIQLTYEVPA